MIRMLTRAFVLALILAIAATGQTLDETARALSKRVAARLAPAEAVHITAHNLTSLPASDLTKAQAAFSRGLRKVGKSFAEITLTISENVRGYLLVAELLRQVDQSVERAVDMAPFEATRSMPAELPVIQKSLVWEQDEPILDVAIRGDQMLVLGTTSLARYTRADGVWQRGEARVLPETRSRDPRGQVGEGDSFTMLAPANTFQAEGWTPYYSRAHWKSFDLAAEPDGLVHLYDGAHQQMATIDNWGSDVVAVSCGVLATAPNDNTITAWDIVDRKPRQVSEALDLGGPVTALWPTAGAGGALAVVRNPGSKKYAAYILTLDCAR